MRRLLYIASTVAFTTVLALFSLLHYANTPAGPVTGRGKLVVIPKAATLADIEKILVEQGVLADDLRFALTARLFGMSRSLKAGEYLMQAGSAPIQVLNLLAAGRTYHHRITITEGATMEGIAAILEGAGWINGDRFLQLARDPDLLESLAVPADSLEGYLFPDTYSFGKGEQDELGILTMMVSRLRRVVKELEQETGEKIGDQRLHRMLTLASIVEKETSVDEEMPLIAGVFFNRLEKKMRLQADPTVIYGLDEFNGRLHRRDLAVDSPYNTYRISGLPPGPIASPGKNAIRSVLAPLAHDYFYFVASGDGITHRFSCNLEEHNRAVTMLRTKKRQKKQSDS